MANCTSAAASLASALFGSLFMWLSGLFVWLFELIG
jgi:hypothetical protein